MPLSHPCFAFWHYRPEESGKNTFFYTRTVQVAQLEAYQAWLRLQVPTIKK